MPSKYLKKKRRQIKSKEGRGNPTFFMESMSDIRIVAQLTLISRVIGQPIQHKRAYKNQKWLRNKKKNPLVKESPS